MRSDTVRCWRAIFISQSFTLAHWLEQTPLLRLFDLKRFLGFHFFKLWSTPVVFGSPSVTFSDYDDEEEVKYFWNMIFKSICCSSPTHLAKELNFKGNLKSRASPGLLAEGPSGLLTSSFAPLERSGRLTHADTLKNQKFQKFSEYMSGSQKYC